MVSGQVCLGLLPELVVVLALDTLPHTQLIRFPSLGLATVPS